MTHIDMRFIARNHRQVLQYRHLKEGYGAHKHIDSCWHPWEDVRVEEESLDDDLHQS